MCSSPWTRVAAALLGIAVTAPVTAGLQGQEAAGEVDRVRSLVAAARATRDSARERDAADRAPRTWTRADTLLARAERALERAGGGAGAGDESALENAAAVAEAARAAFLRARRISALADSLRDRDGGIEAVALRHERSVARIARRLGVDVDPADGVAAEVEGILAAADRRADSVAALRARLDSAQARVRRSDDRADSLADRVAALEARLDSVGGMLERRRQRERDIREVRSLFSGEEASVHVTGDTLELRLTGLTFEPGESTLPDDAGSLLTKVRSAVRAFPTAEVVVEGHTDSRGAEGPNRALSQERAIAVRDHLLLHLPISADRITAAGHGETRPVATNDTEQGRALNRRIEVKLPLPPVGGPDARQP